MNNCIFSTDLCEESFIITSMFEAIFQSFCNHEILKVEFTYISSGRETTIKIEKHDLSAFYWNLNHSNV